MKTIKDFSGIAAFLPTYLLCSVLCLVQLGCSGVGDSGAKTVGATGSSISGTSQEDAKQVLSRYGYSVQEFWQIADRARTEGNMYFMPVNSEIRFLVSNCVPVVTIVEGSLERIELVDSREGMVYPDHCKVEYLYEKIISGPSNQRVITSKMVMKLKHPSYNEHYDLQSLECSGSGAGSEAIDRFNVTYSHKCRVIDNFYGQFESTHSTHVSGIGDNIKVVVDVEISTHGRPEEYMRPGVVQAHSEVDIGTQKTTLIINGVDTNGIIESPGWYLGLRMN